MYTGVFILAVLGAALLLYSAFRPETPEPEIRYVPNTRCSEIDFMFQKNLHGEEVDKQSKRYQVAQRVLKLAPEVRRLNAEIDTLLDDLRDDLGDENVPANLQEMDYLFGKQVHTSFEDRHRGESKVPNYETPVFLKKTL